MSLKQVVHLAVSMAIFVHAAGQPVKSTPEASFPRFTTTEGPRDGDGVPTSGAQLCTLERHNICYAMPSHALDGGQVVYHFGLDPRTERLPLNQGGSWVLFSATFSAGGSGSLERISVLRFEPNDRRGKIVNLLPYVAVTNVSDRAIWPIPEVSPYPLFVDADFIWGAGETHFGPHSFQVGVWCFDPSTAFYKQVLSYRTAKRYDGGDVGGVRVLRPERAEILRRLGIR